MHKHRRAHVGGRHVLGTVLGSGCFPATYLASACTLQGTGHRRQGPATDNVREQKSQGLGVHGQRWAAPGGDFLYSWGSTSSAEVRDGSEVRDRMEESSHLFCRNSRPRSRVGTWRGPQVPFQENPASLF